jgi:DNA modification methylase
MHTWGNDGKPSYAYKHEDIFFACGDSANTLSGSPDDVLDHSDSRFSDMADGSNYHPTQKPVSLIAELLINSTQPGDTVLDPFMGSGTTAVAAIQNGREYIGFEVDADNYRDVIERRIGEAKRQREASVNEGTADD